MKLAEGVYGIIIPQFDRLQGNCYLLEAESGWVVIDTGVNTSRVRATWEKSLEELGIGFGDIKNILITHHHLDHIGGAGWLQQLSGAPVYILDIDYPNATRYQKEEFTRLDAQAFFRSMGYNQFDTNNPLVDFRASVLRLTSPQPQLDLLVDGQSLDYGKFRLEVIWTPGHAPGHMCLYDRERRYLFSGDFLLPDISSHVGFYPGSEANPMKTVLDTLKRMREVEADLVFPGHGPVFTDPASRIDTIIEHHKIRLEAVYAAIEKPASVAQINQVIFGKLDPFNIFLAIGETAAHLEYLIAEGRASKELVDGLVIYKRAGA